MLASLVELTLALASELLDGIFCSPFPLAPGPGPAPNDVELLMPSPSMNMPDVVRCRTPTGPPAGPCRGLALAGLRAGTTMRRPRLASGSSAPASDPARE